jgi:myosin heavy subunit
MTGLVSRAGLDEEKLEEAITTRVRQLPGGKAVRSPQTDVQSRDSRDALAKAVYNKLFDHLVNRINSTFDLERNNPNAPFIGILDIFGFEDMAVNG